MTTLSRRQFMQRSGTFVGAAMAISMFVAVCLGSTLPLALSRLGLDPAIAAGPILTTVTDVAGFF